MFDDDDSFRKVMGRELERMAFSVELFANAEGVTEHVSKHPSDAILLDLRMPGEQGLDVLVRLLAEHATLHSSAAT